MTKAIGKKIICKTVLAGVMTIGLCGLIFVGANNAVLATEMGKEEFIPTTYDMSSFVPEQAADYVKADYKIRLNKLMPSTNVNAISVEEAAEIGAQYLWDMYQADLDGKIIYMSYNVSPITSKAIWLGYVYEKDSDIDDMDNMKRPMYEFLIDSITSERLGISKRFQRNENDENAKTIAFNAKEYAEYYKDNCDEYLQLATEFAEKSAGTKVVSVEFKEVSASLVYMDLKKLKENPEELEAYQLYIVTKVTDEQGRQFEISITEDTKELEYLSIIQPDQDDSNYLG